MDKNSVEWRGYIPAITTPFTKERELDLKGYGRLLEWLLAEGMHGIIVAGTTGEWFSLNRSERQQLFAATGAQLKGKIPLIAGCNAFSAREAIEHATVAAETGFDGILLTPPPYIVPGDDEIYEFYKTVSEAIKLPICVYNWPPGTNIDMSLELLERLSDLDKVVAIKNSTSNQGHFTRVFFALKDKVRNFGFRMDELGMTLIRMHGGDGTMGAGAVLGRAHPDFYNHLWQGELEQARLLGAKDQILMAEWFTESLVGRFGSAQAILKEALNVLGLPGGYPRPPLLELKAEDKHKIRQSLQSLGLVKG